MTNLAVIETEKDLPTVIAPVTPMSMLQMAVQQGADLDKLQKLMDLQERWEKNEARKAFADAMVRFKAIPIEIEKNKDVHHNGKYMYSHATLDNVCRQIIAALHKNGLSHSWKPETTDGKVRVTCIVRHSQGHEESVTLDGSPDTSGSKNPIQAIASTITYLERYSLLAITGIAAGTDDNDGAVPEGGISEAKYQEFEKSINAVKSPAELAELWKVIVKACNDAKDKGAYADLKGMVTVRGNEFKESA